MKNRFDISFCPECGEREDLDITYPGSNPTGPGPKRALLECNSCHAQYEITRTASINDQIA